MNEIDIARLDLNLLKTFDAIARTRSVSRAAESLFLGQPAVSHALARLRELCGDELFVRTREGMVPTERALHLIGPIGTVLKEIQYAFAAQPQFNPVTDAETFTIATSDHIEVAFLSPLVGDIASRFPCLKLRFHPLSKATVLRELDEGRVDLAIGFIPLIEKWHERTCLFQEDLSCVFNAGLIGKQVIGIKEYTQVPQMIVSLDGALSGVSDEVLAELGKERRLVGSTSHFLSLALMAHANPVIVTMPTRLAEYCAPVMGLTVTPLPFKSPSFDVSVVWHKRNSNSRSLGWLRDMILNLSDERKQGENPSSDED